MLWTWLKGNGVPILQDMASQEKLMTLPMVYNILVLQQRRVVPACSEPFAAQRGC